MTLGNKDFENTVGKVESAGSNNLFYLSLSENICTSSEFVLYWCFLFRVVQNLVSGTGYG